MKQSTLSFLAYYGQGDAKPFPYGYRVLDYLESTGDTWIDTGWYHVSPTIYETEVCYAPDPVRGRVFGSGNAGWTNAQSIYLALGSNGFSVLYNDERIDSVFDVNSWHVCRVEGVDGAASAYLDGILQKTVASVMPVLNWPIGLFAWQGAIVSAKTSGLRMRGFKITHGQDIVRDYVPCIRLFDGKPGLYDLCGSICPLTNTPFYVNANTAAALDFTYGELPEATENGGGNSLIFMPLPERRAA